ncbi:solute carrier family 35, member F1/2 [Blastomyces parvus]|uniref:Solute carrier family 35, member F1/2 n=1 Tax=Blastomyces parvus TaxID=2060905 RepID=A0A2B7WYV1_9EURO|nr:solute carrier family 35, member F1/2 [Blastomyces parvus]
MTIAERADTIHVQPKGAGVDHAMPDGNIDVRKDFHGVNVDGGGREEAPGAGAGAGTGVAVAEAVDKSKKGYFAYFRTREFYVVLILGQTLALCITSTNTLSQLLSNIHTSIPAFQSLFNYVLLNLVFTSYTIHRYGLRRWLQVIKKDGWKYIILAFCDVEGNYFIVLAYKYTTILSAQLINFWAIVVVVILSFLFLRVRYHWAQILGILVAIGGMGVLFGSDHITSGGGGGGNGPSRSSQIKGDLFALVGASCYGLTNVAEEYLVSKRPMYEVLGQLGLYGMFIIGVQAAIFDRESFATATWNAKVGGYLTGYTLCLFIFYSLAPILFRLASAAFFNISLLTANFWGVIIGVNVFKYSVHWMYPIAFVCIMLGQGIYYLGRQVLGEARKPWLGENQEKGVSGIGTARRKISAAEAAAAGAGNGATGMDGGVRSGNDNSV